MEIKRILFPTDFSEGSAHAVPYVVDLTRHYGATLVVAHVIYDIAKASGWYVPHVNIDELYRDMEANARKECDKWFAEELRGYQTVEHHVLKGVPSDEILRFADAQKIDLIVMGTHSRKGLDRIIFGSTAERVVRNAKCPVLTVGAPGGK
jgi:nucleotide-binding universal stress UspA family protein